MPALSTAESIGDALKTAVEALALTYGDDAEVVAVVKRKVKLLPSGKDAPAIVIVVSEESRSEAHDARNRLETYSCAVVGITPGGHKVRDDPTPRYWREAFKQTVDDRERTTFAAVTGFNRCDAVNGQPPFDPAALAKDLNYTWVAFDVEVIEARVT